MRNSHIAVLMLGLLGSYLAIVDLYPMYVRLIGSVIILSDAIMCSILDNAGGKNDN